MRSDALAVGASFFLFERFFEFLVLAVFIVAFAWVFHEPLSEAFAYAPYMTEPLFCEAGRQLA
jgi:hypothetical protein